MLSSGIMIHGIVSNLFLVDLLSNVNNTYLETQIKIT